MRKSYQQGQADGLCGIYALLNFIVQKLDWSETPSEILWYLLDAARHHGWLNPYTLTDGFEAYQLKNILDLLIENHRVPYQTFFLQDVVRSFTACPPHKLIERICQTDGSIITKPSGKTHWFLVTKQYDRIVVMDSDSKDKQVRELSPRRSIAMDEPGIVILPRILEQIQVQI